MKYEIDMETAPADNAKMGTKNMPDRYEDTGAGLSRSARKRKNQGFQKIFPAFRRFSDKGQARAAGSIVKFIIALLVITLIARGTNGAALARVRIANPSRGEIIESVTGKATVFAKDTLDITVPEGLTVVEMLAGTGQSVESGEAIARLDLEEIKEKLIRETASLDKLLLDLERLNRAESLDATSLESAQRNLLRAQEDYETTRVQGEYAIAAAQKALDEALSKGVDTADATSVETAQRNLRRAQEDYAIAETQADAGLASAKNALYAAQNDESARLDEWNNAADEDKAEAEQAYRAAQAETEKAQAALSAAENAANESMRNAQRKLEDAQAAFTKAENDYYKASEQTAQAHRSEIDKANTALDDAQTRANDALLAARRKVEDAQASVDKAKKDYGEGLQQLEDTSIQNNISAVSLQLDIDKQKLLVEELALLERNEGSVYANLAGTVESTLPEGAVTNANPLISFVDGARGFEARITLDKTSAQQMAVGDDCQVSTGGGMYYTPTVTGTVSSISSADENDEVDITILLPEGSWSNGQRVDIQAVQGRGTYDLCVPLSALHSNTAGYYILGVEQRSTVLGIENVVIEIPVSLLASDDSNAAVQGPVDRASSIITGSSKAVEAGDRIRMEDS